MHWLKIILDFQVASGGFAPEAEYFFKKTFFLLYLQGSLNLQNYELAPKIPVNTVITSAPQLPEIK